MKPQTRIRLLAVLAVTATIIGSSATAALADGERAPEVVSEEAAADQETVIAPAPLAEAADDIVLDDEEQRGDRPVLEPVADGAEDPWVIAPAPVADSAGSDELVIAPVGPQAEGADIGSGAQDRVLLVAAAIVAVALGLTVARRLRRN